MTRNTDTDRKTTSTARTVAKVAIAGMVVGAPLAAFAGTASAAPASTGNNWDAVAQCESGGNWSTNTGNGFSGGLQFTPSTWSANGGSGSPQGASREQQIQVANRVLATQGPGAWPVCGKNLGAASSSSSSSSFSSSSPSAKSAPAKAAPAKAAPTKSAPTASTGSTAKHSAPQSTPAAAPTNYAPKHTSSAPATTRSTLAAGADYTVQSGDTLSTIAQNQGVQGGYQALFSLNQGTVKDVNMIYVGQQLALR